MKLYDTPTIQSEGREIQISREETSRTDQPCEGAGGLAPETEYRKPVSGWEGRYWVDTEGNVWSRYYSGSLKDNWRILKPALDQHGYYRLSLVLGKTKTTEQVHRLVAKEFIPGYLEGLCVNHKNSIRTDNRIENLEWVTPKQNHYHAMLNDRHSCGERHGCAKVTSVIVREMRALSSLGVMGKDIAVKFKLTKQMVSRILNGKNWKNNV